MIARLHGTLLAKGPTEAVVDVGGVGYALSIPLSTFERLGDTGSAVTLLTHLHVREDSLQLFGFATDTEREMFRLLLSVSGIGPKLAQTVLSGIPAADLRAHIGTGNLGALTAVPGVGRKTAERLVLELREKMARLTPDAPSGLPGESSTRQEALLALTSLGYPRPAAERAVRAALQASPEAEATLESLIKAALRTING
jgi:Holliday junction DNA helicase RuvA